MNRLTQKELSSNGQVHCTGGTSPDCNDSCINTTCEWQKKADRKLWEYENAEENGVTDYNKGMNDAWEIAKKLYLNKKNGGLSEGELEEIFGQFTTSEIFMRYTPQEVKAKIKAWELARQEIKVGDVVIVTSYEEPQALVVTCANEDDWCVLMNRQGKSTKVRRKALTKTGRTIDIASVLSQIGGTA